MRTRHLTAVLMVASMCPWASLRSESPHSYNHLAGATSAYYQGYVPHVAILDKSGNPVYNSSGEVEESRTSAIFDALLRPARGSQ